MKMALLTPCLLLPTIILSLLIPHSCSADETQKLIIQICSRTYDFGYCKSVFNQHLYTPTMDAQGLTQIAVTQTLISATNTLRFILKTIDSEKSVELKNIYKICEVGYENLVNEFTDASFDFAKRDYESMLFNVGKCDRFVSDCQYVLGNQASDQLSTQNNQNRVLVQMSLFSGQLIGN
ncbi:hypothetical protein OROMI_014893 [Orobanche minor]